MRAERHGWPRETRLPPGAARLPGLPGGGSSSGSARGSARQRLRRYLGVPAKADREDAVKIQNEIRSHLMKAGKPAYVEETFVSFDDACRLILELGGIPCYPTLADGTSPICPFETPVEKLIDEIKGARHTLRRVHPQSQRRRRCWSNTSRRCARPGWS